LLNLSREIMSYKTNTSIFRFQKKEMNSNIVESVYLS